MERGEAKTRCEPVKHESVRTLRDPERRESGAAGSPPVSAQPERVMVRIPADFVGFKLSDAHGRNRIPALLLAFPRAIVICASFCYTDSR